MNPTTTTPSFPGGADQAIGDRSIRTVSEDDDDFYLDEIFEDDYERRRHSAHRGDYSYETAEFRHYDFWD